MKKGNAINPIGVFTESLGYDAHGNYLLGGSMVLQEEEIDKVLFEGGFFTATRLSPTTYGFTAYHYNKDHLGNNREVVGPGGSVQQVTNYYPFGAPYADPSAVTGAYLQPYKYNGKELDRMHGLDTYDYGARQYDPILGRWDRMDPLCEKYYDVSPYAYCHDNPVNRIDVYGMWDTLNISNNNNNVLFVISDSYKKNKELQSDYNSASRIGMPIVLVKNVEDFAKALTAIGADNIKSTVTINSHGKPGQFYIGNEKVTKDTDLSGLEILNQSQIFISACRTAEGEIGEQLLKHIADQLICTVYGSCHYVNAGYKYDGSVIVGSKPSPTFEMDGKLYSKDNLFKVSNLNGTKHIFDLSIDKIKGLKFNEWNPIQINK